MSIHDNYYDEPLSPLQILLQDIESFNDGQIEQLKRESKRYYKDLSDVLDKIIRLIGDDRGTDNDRNKLKLFLAKLNKIREYHRNINPIEFQRIQKLKIGNKREYFDDDNPNILLVIDRMMTKIETNWKSVSVSRY